jgi:hypothetical protein
MFLKQYFDNEHGAKYKNQMLRTNILRTIENNLTCSQKENVSNLGFMSLKL